MVKNFRFGGRESVCAGIAVTAKADGPRRASHIKSACLPRSIKPGGDSRRDGGLISAGCKAWLALVLAGLFHKVRVRRQHGRAQCLQLGLGCRSSSPFPARLFLADRLSMVPSESFGRLSKAHETTVCLLLLSGQLRRWK